MEQNQESQVTLEKLDQDKQALLVQCEDSINFIDKLAKEKEDLSVQLQREIEDSQVRPLPSIFCLFVVVIAKLVVHMLGEGDGV